MEHLIAAPTTLSTVDADQWTTIRDKCADAIRRGHTESTVHARLIGHGWVTRFPDPASVADYLLASAIAVAKGRRAAEAEVRPPSQAEVPPSQPVVVATEPPTAVNYDDKLIARMAELDTELDALATITQSDMDRAEIWIKVRISDRGLAAINQSLGKLGRRAITYQDLAATALLHRDSVRRQHGESPHKRFLAYSRTKATHYTSPVDSCHIKRMMETLQAIGWTELVKPPQPQLKKAGVYTVIDLP